ncbi:MAG: methylmalonyl-CoA mutase family protein [Spirochaetes bacterium]|nr:methylmalonyl-CoA mutase family protein [Spirochaetota bacterium]HOD16595.1 methylmalonyl-CoA mutase family protein [Spirochaetota bacterium]
MKQASSIETHAGPAGSSEHEHEIYRPKHRVRIVTATSLFDGHDVAINIFRRILQESGAEVIHLGHNRSVDEIVSAAIEEDVQGIAVSCYQGGHMEFFKYIIDLLKERGASHVRLFGGGGGVIVPEEVRELEAYGVAKIYTPEHGAAWGLQGIINHLMSEVDRPVPAGTGDPVDGLSPENKGAVARLITMAETARKKRGAEYERVMKLIREKAGSRVMPVIGMAGTGGAGKSSLIDELVVRLLRDFGDIHVAVLCSDPAKRRSGGALLGDRIRMNAITCPRVYMRSFAADHTNTDFSDALADTLQIARAAGFDLAIAETAGLGQGSAGLTDTADVSMYVMTSEYGAASQLEKITMLDYADAVVINKFEKEGADDALRDVRKQVQRNRKDFSRAPEEMPVFGTIASRFNDDGVTALYHALLDLVNVKAGTSFHSAMPRPAGKASSSKTIIIPPNRTRYLAEIAETVRGYHARTEEQAEAARRAWHLREAAKEFGPGEAGRLAEAAARADGTLDAETKFLLSQWDSIREDYGRDELTYRVRGQEIRTPLYYESLARKKIPKIALPRFTDPGEIYRWLREENVPGRFPYTAGVFPLKRMDEDPTRMFAGEGNPERTNARFRLLSGGFEATRLSTAFDSVTLYGRDPETRPDVYGKVGTSGVSVCTLDDVKVLYGGFDLCAPSTSVSMTINGPAPIMLAMFLNTAIDQQADRFEAQHKRRPAREELERIRAEVLSCVRGTVQADILKEDQGQNTCIFSIDFALRMMGDIQQFFIDNNVRNLYSVSISGYHIAEAGANPITQLAFTLANGFTYAEYYLSRGMPIDSFAPNLSFFFSNGMDPEYTVIGRVARRIWAVAMREKYGAAPRSQMLKYHIQTSGRSLHSQEIQFNDIRTTLQALCAVYDNCNSLHTNAYDEAITTPSRESVRRALAIQQIINREWGLARNENPEQGSFIVEELTRLVEEAVLSEFDRITERGGVLGAMEKGYQRSQIQEESMHYEALKHSGELPIVGVNAFLDGETSHGGETTAVELARATEDEKLSQLRRLEAFKQRNAKEAPAALALLQQAALSGTNIFAELMNTVRHCSIGQITGALYEVGGQYRRSM